MHQIWYTASTLHPEQAFGLRIYASESTGYAYDSSFTGGHTAFETALLTYLLNLEIPNSRWPPAAILKFTKPE